MRLVLTSHSFAPAVGGVETASASLAREFSRAGHEVTVVTYTPGPVVVDRFDVVRRPSPRALVSLVRAADVTLQNNVSLRTLWPALLLRRPVVVSVATWVRGTDGRVRWRDRLKQRVLRRVRLVAVSRAVASHVRSDATVIHNSYRADVFVELENAARDRDFVFVGRLVSDKGVDVLLDAIGRLGDSDGRITLTIVGEGPERPRLEALAATGRADVRFTGSLSGEHLNRELNRHHTIVVPSTWDEPFGIVALEGIASGCVAVVSSGGGLPEAAGPCGLTFRNGDAAALATQLEEALKPEVRAGLRLGAPSHLAAHSPESEALSYLEVMEDEVRRHGRRVSRT